jgi:hypothetical protein
MCDTSLNEGIHCYRFITLSNVDSRKVLMPMERTQAGDWQMPEAQLYGYTPIEDFSTYVGSRPWGNSFPNPLRGGFVLISLLDQSFAAIDLNEVLRSTGDMSTISLCFGEVGMNVGDLNLPGNLLLPDIIRQNWQGACSGNMKMSNPMTIFRVFTNTPSITRKIQVMGASVVSSNFNIFKSLNIAELPITMTAIGSDTVNIPALPGDINRGDIGGGV